VNGLIDPEGDPESTSPAPIQVMLVDDSDADRSLLRLLLGHDGRFEVVGEAADGAEAINLALELRPDVIVLDLRMPLMDGFQALSGLRSVSPQSRILTCTGFDEDFGRDSVELGADDYISKNAVWRDLRPRVAALMKKPPAARTVRSTEWLSPYILATMARLTYG